MDSGQEFTNYLGNCIADYIEKNKDTCRGDLMQGLASMCILTFYHQTPLKGLAIQREINDFTKHLKDYKKILANMNKEK